MYYSEKEDAESQTDLGEKVFDTAEELVVAVLRQLTGGQMSKDGISDTESAGWRYGVDLDFAYLGTIWR